MTGPLLSWKPNPVGTVIKTLTNEAVLEVAEVINTATEVDLEDGNVTPISNQGGQPTCASNSGADGLEILLSRERRKPVQVSRKFLHWNSKNYLGTTQVKDGTYLYLVFRSMKEDGVCAESDCPYIDNDDYMMRRPPLMAYENADSNKITDFYAITQQGTSRGDAAEKALRGGLPVNFGTLVDKAFIAFRGGKVLTLPAGATEGGHAMLIVGVRRLANGKRLFKIRNSWGTGWGDDGYAWVTEEYIVWGSTSDLQVPVRVGRDLVLG